MPDGFGKKPEGTVTVEASAAPRFKPAKRQRKWWDWGLAISLIGLVATLVAWFWPFSPTSPLPPIKPGIYAVRVQVLDPQSRPVSGSTVRTSAGNEPHLLPDGWWEIQIPAAKVPADGLITLWATHEAWEGSHVEQHLGRDTNLRVEIRLKVPESWLRGRVVDGHDRALPGVRVSRQNGERGEAITDADGRFELKLSVPPETRVRLRSEHAGFPLGDDFCYSGRDSCPIVLERR